MVPGRSSLIRRVVDLSRLKRQGDRKGPARGNLLLSFNLVVQDKQGID